MHMAADNRSCFDVRAYPASFLRYSQGLVAVAVTYMRQWHDGFGARGWKIDASIGDPVIIASTRETGNRIPTSVFVHDVLDHYLSGFGISGHRSEAMALVQLSRRTGSDPLPDYRQLIAEDILNGVVNGESMTDFLPCKLLEIVALSNGKECRLSDSQIIDYLVAELGRDRLLDVLAEHFLAIGMTGEPHAQLSWASLGLDDGRRADMGLAIQRLLERVDTQAEKNDTENMKGFLSIHNEGVAFSLFEFETGESQYKLPVIEDSERV
jgi:hypothetical protein